LPPGHHALNPEFGQQQPATFPGLIIRPIFSILSIPFSLISGIFRFIFGVLRIPFPNLTLRLGNGLGFYSPLGRTRPTNRGGADRWIRELEEETGAVSMGRLKASKGVSSGVSSGDAAGPSGLTSRGNANGASEGPDEEGRRVLPDFVLGTYEEVLKTCQREIRIGCVILVSEEHDDVAEFKR
jgi:FAS-associated factor 2